MRRQKNKLPIKPILLVALVILLGVMLFNSGLLVKIGLLKGNIPDDIGIDPNDPRVTEKVDEALDRSLINSVVNKFVGLITGKLEQGKVVIFADDTANNFGIPDFEFEIRNAITNEVLQTITTDSSGIAESEPLDYRHAYRVVQKFASYPFVLKDEEVVFEMKASLIEVHLGQEAKSYIKHYSKDSNNKIIVDDLFIPVPVILQKPELPNGCEITALTSILNFYNYPIDKVTLSNQFLPKAPFYMKGGKLYGADPTKAFSGDPNNANGWFVYPEPVVVAVTDYIQSVGGTHTAKNITGSTSEEILAYVYDGIPVAVWGTTDMKPATYDYGWTIDGTDVYFDAATNLHCMVIQGIVGDQVYVMDPLLGSMIYDKATFFASYESLGSRAIVIEEALDEK